MCNLLNIYAHHVYVQMFIFMGALFTNPCHKVLTMTTIQTGKTIVLHFTFCEADVMVKVFELKINKHFLVCLLVLFPHI
jgi:hypothetical protein